MLRLYLRMIFAKVYGMVYEYGGLGINNAYHVWTEKVD